MQWQGGQQRPVERQRILNWLRNEKHRFGGVFFCKIRNQRNNSAHFDLRYRQILMFDFPSIARAISKSILLMRNYLIVMDLMASSLMWALKWKVPCLVK
jgi:hypothetical protein